MQYTRPGVGLPRPIRRSTHKPFLQGKMTTNDRDKQRQRVPLLPSFEVVKGKLTNPKNHDTLGE